MRDIHNYEQRLITSLKKLETIPNKNNLKIIKEFVRSNIVDYYADDSKAWKLLKGFGWFLGYAILIVFIEWLFSLIKI